MSINSNGGFRLAKRDQAGISISTINRRSGLVTTYYNGPLIVTHYIQRYESCSFELERLIGSPRSPCRPTS